MKEGQQIIFKHPVSGTVYSGFVTKGSVIYQGHIGAAHYPIEFIKEWADAEAAFNAFALQLIRYGDLS